MTATSPAARLAHWMRRALAECDRARRGLDPDTVHDLRVALRRCRSMAKSLMEIDPDADWRRMRKAGRRLFRALGDLRDTQVMRGWTEKLVPPDDVTYGPLIALLDAREAASGARAAEAVRGFEHHRWRSLTDRLTRRMRQARLDRRVFLDLARQRYDEALALHRRARRTRSQAAYHRLRIGVKRFRYTVENFLPDRAAAWEADLKQVQDLLGELHDLDVLWTTVRRSAFAADSAVREAWRDRWQRERTHRLAAYHALTTGPGSRWRVWGAGLPAATARGGAAFARLGAWASFRDPDFAEKPRIATRARQLFDALGGAGLPAPFGDARARRILGAAALVHDVGRAEGRKQHAEASERLVRGLPPSPGWSADDLALVGLVSRYHRGDPPAGEGPLAARPPEDRATVLALAGVLRLARAFAGEPARFTARRTGEALVLEVHGARHDPVSVDALRKKWLLELACGCPVVIQSRP